MDDGVAALGGGAELVEHRLDVAGAEVGDELLEPGVFEVELDDLVVDLLEEGGEERVRERNRPERR